MIVIKLFGGLGNQMFCYAAGRALAARHDVPLKLDLTHYREQDYRKFELGAWNICAEAATEEELRAFQGKDFRLLKNRIINKMAFWRSYGERPWYCQRGFGYDAEFRKIGPEAYVEGHFQSEKYFEEAGDILRREFTLRAPLDGANAAMEREILAREGAVAIHVRRTDYVTDEDFRKTAQACPPGYYEAAMARAASQVRGAHFFVFSDEPEWCKANLRPPAGCTYVDINPCSQPALDIHLMRQCRHHIISNSSFSWWGAWLADTRPGHVVIAPEKWFVAKGMDDKDLVPERWTKI